MYLDPRPIRIFAGAGGICYNVVICGDRYMILIYRILTQKASPEGPDETRNQYQFGILPTK